MSWGIVFLVLWVAFRAIMVYATPPRQITSKHISSAMSSAEKH